MIDQALAAGFSRGFLIASGITVLALAAVAALVRQPCPIGADHPPVPIGCPGTLVPGMPMSTGRPNVGIGHFLC
jgi:hypothetical protein